ncbi:MAG: hypothetical protein ACK5SQ_03095 [Chitinophagales bacterium]|jgi:hypothetical protein
MRPTFFYVLATLGLLACQSSPKPTPNRLFLDCYVRILESEGQVLAEATMLSIPTQANPTQPAEKTPVEIPGGIRYQGSPMSARPGSGLTYSKAFPGEFVSEHTFSWDDKEQKRRTFSFKMNQIESFSLGASALSINQPAQFTWKGGALERGEALVLMWENPKENLTVPMEFIVQGALSVADLPAAKMKELSPGTWTLYVVRKKLVKFSEDSFDAQAILEFYSKTDTIQITK